MSSPTMESAVYRPLQPRIGRLQVTPDLGARRKRASIACDACREKRSRCDSVRPICSSCRVRGSTCVYITKDDTETRSAALKRENRGLRERNDAFEELFNHLRLLPEDHAQAVLEKIRTAPDSTRDPWVVLNAVRGNPQLTQPSAQRTAFTLLPQIYSGVELALSVRHPNAYPNLSLLTNSISSTIAALGDQLPDQEALPGPIRPSKVPRSDFGLENLNIGFWTAVPVSDEFAKGAISLYLEIDHPTVGTFDAQLFIADLLALKLDFCSPFLVSCLLAYASQGYVTKDVSASARSHDFEQEAERLLEVEKTDSLTTLSGLALLSYSYGTHGQYSDGLRKYAEKALQMGQRMKLFGTPDVLRYHDIRFLPAHRQRGLSSAAWGGFNTIMLLSLSHVISPTAHPPDLPHPAPPEETESDEQREEGYILTQYSSDITISSFCNVWTLLSEVISFYRNPQQPGVPTPAFAYSKYNRLLTIANDLPPQMIRQEHSSLRVLFFHIIYHSTVLEIFRPFLPHDRIQTAKYVEASTASPETIFAASVQQLKSVVIECIRCPGAKATIFWAGVGLLQVANAVLKDLTSPDWQHHFLFCIRSYQLLFPAFAICKGVVQGLLAMAVNNGAITSCEAMLIVEEFSKGGNFHSAIVRPTGGFVVDLDMAVKDAGLAGIDTWLDRFEEMNVFSKFTTDVL